MKYAIFSGCLILTRFPEYEKSAWLVLENLGFEMGFIDAFSCCGSQIVESIDESKLFLINARNFALAEQKGIEKIVTLCGSCTYILKKTHSALQDAQRRHEINDQLSKIGLSFEKKVQIQHLAELLNDPNVFQQLKSNLKKRIPLKLAFQNPCMLYRPERISQVNKDEKDLISNLLKECGAEVVPYEFQDQCCEGTMIAFKKDVGEPLVKIRHESIQNLGIDLFVVGCPNCQLVYSVFPSVLHSEMVPTVFFPQILGLALGHSFKEVGLNRNIDSKKIKNIVGEK